MRQNKIHERLQHQDGVVAVWQLLADGHTEGVVRHAVGGLRELQKGVYMSGHAKPTDQQRWRAGTLTARSTVLTGPSGLAFHGLGKGDAGVTTICRPGSGGVRRTGRRGAGELSPLVVTRSKSLPNDTVWSSGIPVLSPGRLVLDALPALLPRHAHRLVRDALRLKKVSPAEFQMIIGRHSRRRGLVSLRNLVNEYAPLGLHRTRSDAEALALAILQAARVAPPSVNVLCAGEEADLSWLALRLIVELDGPAFHQFPTEDARKQAAWERAGWTVLRLPTDDVYDHPAKLLALCPAPTPQPARNLWLPNSPHHVTAAA